MSTTLQKKEGPNRTPETKSGSKADDIYQCTFKDTWLIEHVPESKVSGFASALKKQKISSFVLNRGFLQSNGTFIDPDSKPNIAAAKRLVAILNEVPSITRLEIFDCVDNDGLLELAKLKNVTDLFLFSKHYTDLSQLASNQSITNLHITLDRSQTMPGLKDGLDRFARINETAKVEVEFIENSKKKSIVIKDPRSTSYSTTAAALSSSSSSTAASTTASSTTSTTNDLHQPPEQQQTDDDKSALSMSIHA